MLNLRKAFRAKEIWLNREQIFTRLLFGRTVSTLKVLFNLTAFSTVAGVSLYAIEASHVSVPITQAFELAVFDDGIINYFDITGFYVF